MTVRELRCTHCKVRYAHQMSGAGCADPLNDNHYCPTCKTVVLETLKTIPTAVEKVFVDVDREERELVLTVQNPGPLPRNIPGNPLTGIRIQQVSPGLQDPETGATMHVRVVIIHHREYYISSWPDGREPERVTRAMEHNLQTGQMVPWQKL